MNFVIDVNIIVDLVLKRNGYREYIKILNSLIFNKNGFLCVSSIHTIDYVVNKIDSSKRSNLRKLIEKLQYCKSPSYIDITHKHFQVDPEDYIVDLSARAIGAKVITTDKKFLRDSEIAIHPDDFFDTLREDRSTMNFIDLEKQNSRISTSIERKIDAVFNHGKFIMGPEIGELEELLADYVGVKHCVTVSSGTDALIIPMMALDIQPGDEVITSPFTFIATAEMIALLRAKPVFVDIDPKTYNINPDLVEGAITGKTKAIMPVSLYGQCADMDHINKIAAKHGLPVIEDGAQSFGATYKGKRSCGLSTVGCTSFFPSKPLGCYGDGGACFTDDDDLAMKMRQIRVHGQDRRYHHPLVGMNGRMDTLQAAVLLAKMEIFDDEVKSRIEIGARYTELLKDYVVTPYIEPFNTSVYAQYTIQVDERDMLREKLDEAGVPTAVHYPVPLHKQPAFKEHEGDFLPVAEEVSARVLSLPMHPYLTKENQDRVVNLLIK